MNRHITELRPVINPESLKPIIVRSVADALSQYERDNKQVSGKSKEGAAYLNRRLIRLLTLCGEFEISPPAELIQAIERQLGVSENPRKAYSEKEFIRAMELLAEDPNLSNRKLAKACKVSVPTISRWRKDPLFERGVQEERDYQVHRADLSDAEKKALDASRP
jgi:primosomal protein N'